MNQLLILIISAALPCMHSKEMALQITRFQQDSGIYFEKIGKVQLTNMDWNLLVYFDLATLKTELNSFHQYLDEIQTICTKVSKLDSHCQNIISFFRGELNICAQKQERIFRQNPRSKRGLIDGIGVAAKYLFGTLNADDAVYYDKQISILKQNDGHLLNLIKNQTLIVDSTVKIFKSTHKEINEQFKTLVTRILTLTNEINKLNSELSMNIFATRLNTIIMTTSLAMNKFAKVQEIIIDLLDNIKHGRPDSLIITNDVLRHQLDVIRQNLPAQLILPFQSHGNDLTETLKIIKIDTTIHGDRLLIKLGIPLLSRETYTIYRVIPIPTPLSGQYAFIQPTMKYIAIDPSKDNYYSMTQSELTSCVNTNQNFICDQLHPIFSTQRENRVCEVELLNHAEVLPKDCQVRVTDPYRFYIRLTELNSWIFVLDQSYPVDVTCGTETTTYNLTGSGIFKIRPGCSFRNRDIRIDAHSTKTTFASESYVPPINLSSIDHSLPPLKPSLENSKSILINSPSGTELDVISKNINDLMKNEVLPANIPHHDIHHYTLIYVTLICLIFAITGYLYHHDLLPKFRKNTNSIDLKTNEVNITMPERNRVNIPIEG